MGQSAINSETTADLLYGWCSSPQRPRRGNIPNCTVHFARWVRDLAGTYDAAQAMQPALDASQPVETEPNDNAPDVTDLAKLLDAAQLPQASRDALTQDAKATGAVHVQTLMRSDWEQLASWQCLLPLQRRRLLQHVPP